MGLLPPDPPPPGCNWIFWPGSRIWVKTDQTDVRNVDTEDRELVVKRVCVDIPTPIVSYYPQPELPDRRNPKKPPVGTNPGGQIGFDHLIRCTTIWKGDFDLWRLWKEISDYALRCKEECGKVVTYPGGSKRPTGEEEWRYEDSRSDYYEVIEYYRSY
jgi:hypothetical protein